MARTLELYDECRIDHFRGFAGKAKVPVCEWPFATKLSWFWHAGGYSTSGVCLQYKWKRHAFRHTSTPVQYFLYTRMNDACMQGQVLLAGKVSADFRSKVQQLLA